MVTQTELHELYSLPNSKILIETIRWNGYQNDAMQLRHNYVIHLRNNPVRTWVKPASSE